MKPWKVRAREQQYLAVPLAIGFFSGLAGLAYLFFIPADPKNSVLLGFSLLRLLEGLGLLVGSLTLGYFLIIELQEPDLAIKLFSRLKLHGRPHWGLVAAWIILLIIFGVSTFGPSLFSNQIAMIERLFPVLMWAGVVISSSILVYLFWAGKSRLVENLTYLVKTGLVGFLLAFIFYMIAFPAIAGLILRKGSLIFLLALFPLIYWSFKRRDLWGGLAAFALFLLLIGGSLIGVWTSGVTDFNIVAGLQPFNDANGYYHGGRLLTQGQPFHQFSAKRPLFPALLGVLFWLSGENLQIVIAVFCLIAICAIFLASIEVDRSAGPLAAAFLGIGLFLFIRRFIGSTMSEIIGLPLGAVGFALLWCGASRKRLVDAAAGILMLSLGLLSRAGPFFMLPTLILWGGLGFRKEHQKFNWRSAGILAVSSGVAFVIHWVIYSVFAGTDSSSMSNFSYTLYGLVTGGTGWKQYAVDHPELATMAEPALSQTIYRYVWEAVKSNPGNMLTGAIRYWGYFFSYEWSGLFGFIEGSTLIESFVGRGVMAFVSLLGVFRIVRGVKKKHYSMVLMGIVGILLSVPFVPTIDAEIRTYAAAIPWFVAPGAVFLGEWYASQSARHAGDPEEGKYGTSWSLWSFSILLIVLIFIAPLILRVIIKPVDIPSNAHCSNDQRRVITRVTPGTYINIVPDTYARISMVPNLKFADYSRSLHDAPMFDVSRELLSVKPGRSFFTGYDRESGEFKNIIVPTEILQQNTGWVELCGFRELTPSGYDLFQVESARRLKP